MVGVTEGALSVRLYAQDKLLTSRVHGEVEGGPDVEKIRRHWVPCTGSTSVYGSRRGTSMRKEGGEGERDVRHFSGTGSDGWFIEYRDGGGVTSVSVTKITLAPISSGPQNDIGETTKSNSNGR